MLNGSNAHLSLWGDATIQACYVYNRTPLKVIGNSTPYELLNGRAPDLSKIKVFGSNVYYSINESERSKIQPTSNKGAWIGFDERKNGHRILIDSDGHVIVSRDVKHIESKFSHLAEIMGAQPEPTGNIGSSSAVTSQSALSAYSSVDTLSVDPFDIDDTTVALDTSINEESAIELTDDPISSSSSPTNDQLFSDDDGFNADMDEQNNTGTDTDSTCSGSDVNDDQYSSTESDDELTTEVEPLNSINPPLSIQVSAPITTRSGRVIKPVNRYGTVSVGDLEIDDQHRMLSAALLHTAEFHPEPQSYAAAMRHPDAVYYEKAASEEIANMAARGVYELAPYHSSMNVITSKWVFKVKLDMNNMPIKYKARLVARGFQQKEGIDYFETFAPVVKNKSMRIVFALAVKYRLKVKQIDFCTAFLNADLDETIYMHQPEGFAVKGANGEKLVWRLKKALYGLKQSPNKWNEELDSTLVKLGYQPTVCDPCIYVKRMDGYQPIFLTLYVDDTLAVYDPAIEHVWLADKEAISKLYPITDMDDCKWVLNMEVTQSDDRSMITLSQRAYIERILKQFNMLDCKPAPTPAAMLDLTDPQLKPGEPLSPAQHELYRKIVGSVLYASNTTRIDIAYTVGILSRFISSPTTTHLTAAKRLLRYLRGTMDYCLKFEDNGLPDLELTVYADSNWAGDKTDRKSTSGYLVLLNGNPISWQARKHSGT